MNYIKLGGGGAFKFDGVNAIVQDPLTGVVSFTRNTTTIDYDHVIYEGTDESYQALEELATNNRTTVGQTFDSMSRQYKDGASGDTFGDTVNDNYQIQKNGTTLFKIFNNGRIGTNQLKAAVVRVTQAHEIPVYDTAGTLHGYIKVFT
jgi:hypothetical protein